MKFDFAIEKLKRNPLLTSILTSGFLIYGGAITAGFGVLIGFMGSALLVLFGNGENTTENYYYAFLMDKQMNIKDGIKGAKFNLVRWLRNRIFTGIIIALPLIATIAGISWIVQLIDNNVLKILPRTINPNTYLGFNIPGLGLIISLFLFFILGLLASNFIGKSAIKAGEYLLTKVPVVSPVYNSLKQIINTVANQKERAFRDVCLIEYPRKGIWAIGFISTTAKGEVSARAGNTGALLSIFVPTTPNPTSGFLLFFPAEDVIELDMSVEDAAKLVISAGLVYPNGKELIETITHIK